MINLKYLLKLLSKLHDGQVRNAWPHPVNNKIDIATSAFWGRFKDRYHLK